MSEFEMFVDENYYHLWTVRPIGDRDFKSLLLKRFDNQADAKEWMEICERAHKITGQ